MNTAVIVLLVLLAALAVSVAAGYAFSSRSARLRAMDVRGGIGARQKAFVRFSSSYCRIGGRVLAYGILFLTCAASLFPFLWMISSSLKTPAEVSNTMRLVFFPASPQWSNYARAWTTIDMVGGFLNTMIIEVATIPVCVIVSSLEAFAFSKMYMRHKTVHLLILLSGLMVPYASVVLPLYRAYYKLGFINTFWPLILPTMFGSVSQMFFYIQYQKGIPDAMFESGKMDGAGYLQQFVHIMLPMMGPAIAAQVVFMFIGNWNDFFAPSLYLTNENVKTLQLKLKSLSDGNRMDLPYVFAGAAITCVPLFAIYFAFQRYFVGGLAITGTGVKG